MSLGLLEAYSSSSSSENEEEEDQSPKVSNDLEPKLSNPFGPSVSGPLPSYLVSTAETSVSSSASPIESSVFSNPFKAKEDRKKALLERHVTMTSKQEESRTINGKKVCWNFRKGRCRLGHKCPYAHDSDIGVSENLSSNGDSVRISNLNNKKRPGLGDSINPSKKARKFHDKIYNNK